MSSWGRFLVVGAVLVGATLVPSAAAAVEPHSYCVTGPVLVLGAGDTDTNNIINAVCKTSGKPCCSTSTGTSNRWDLACVQLAARYARDNFALGDVCGRYAWTQGPILKTGQFYPRDFNVFALGSLSGISDTEGPVGAAAATSFNSFHVNSKQKEPIALLAGGPVIIGQGTLAGSVLYASNYSDTQVTYVGAARPTTPTIPFAVNFADATTKLIAMSQAIKNYTAIPAAKQNSTITMTGSDPEMNVFTISASQLINTYTYVFNVPTGSSVYVNVAGTNPTIANAGFSGNLVGAQILWNFPDATNLTMSGISLPGSILAPKATSQLNGGTVTGTVVVGSASVSMELYAIPFHVPSSIAKQALWVDPTWSMPGYVSDDQTATDLTNEAGFIDISATTYNAEGSSRSSPEHRIWYSFQPASVQPKKKPLAVFFNGGPGSATSAYLFSFNTSTLTLDPCKVGGPSCTVGATKAVFNPSTWTQFANLLYVDAPAAGFSYPIGSLNPVANPSIGIDIDRDAGIFDEVVMRFMLKHPQILSNRVLLVGESYGGTRATMMLEHLFDYVNLTSSSSNYQDTQLAGQEASFFSAVFGTSTPTRQQLVSKFSGQVLIDPALVGKWQLDRPTQGTVDEFNRGANCLSDIVVRDSTGATTTNACWTSAIPMSGIPGWDATCDAYDCDKPPHYLEGLAMTAATNLNLVGVLEGMVGANVKNIEWMYGRSRPFAYGRLNGTVPPTPEMLSTFGLLGPFDRYYLIDNDDAGLPYVGADGVTASYWSTESRGTSNAGYVINRLIDGVSTFITVAKHDTVVYSPDIRYAIDSVRAATPAIFASVTGTSYDKTADNPFIYPPGTVKARHGRMEIDIGSPATAFYATMPGLYESGHTVSARAPAELLADVMEWYARSQP
jgi:choice-of-anchor A domain-containing protein